MRLGCFCSPCHAPERPSLADMSGGRIGRGPSGREQNGLHASDGGDPKPPSIKSTGMLGRCSQRATTCRCCALAWPPRNIGFLLIFFIFMACGVRLEELVAAPRQACTRGRSCIHESVLTFDVVVSERVESHRISSYLRARGAVKRESLPAIAGNLDAHAATALSQAHISTTLGRLRMKHSHLPRRARRGHQSCLHPNTMS